MMKTTKKLLLLIFILPFILISCSNDDDDYGTIAYSRIGTVVNPEGKRSFDFKVDRDSALMRVRETYISNYTPKDGQRVWARFSILSEELKNSDHNYDVRLLNVYEILTKGIFDITPETQDSIGNDPIYIDDIWIANDYLNVQFRSSNDGRTAHYINLVPDKDRTTADGKVHLQFRHNANNDFNHRLGWGLVSFDLRSLKSATASAEYSIQIQVSAKEHNNPNAEYNLVYKFNGLDNKQHEIGQTDGATVYAQ